MSYTLRPLNGMRSSPATCFQYRHSASLMARVPPSYRAHVTRITPSKSAASDCVSPRRSRAAAISLAVGMSRVYAVSDGNTSRLTYLYPTATLLTVANQIRRRR